jgi:hypothetical protein
MDKDIITKPSSGNGVENHTPVMQQHACVTPYSLLSKDWRI